MKKKLFYRTTMTAAGILVAISAFCVSAAPVNEEKAKAIALDNAEVNEENVVFLYAEQDVDDGRLIYEVELITKANEEYDYEILMDTGEILGISYEKKAYSVWGDNTGKDITVEKAQELALNHAGVVADKAIWIKQKKDFDDGKLIYELEFYTNDFQEYEYDIDGTNGEVIAWEFDADSAYARQDAARRLEQAEGSTGKKNEEKGLFRLADVKATVLKQADAEDKQVTWGRVHRTFDDGKLVYEGKFYVNSLEYEFKIDAATGTVVDWDVESIWD